MDHNVDEVTLYNAGTQQNTASTTTMQFNGKDSPLMHQSSDVCCGHSLLLWLRYP